MKRKKCIKNLKEMLEEMSLNNKQSLPGDESYAKNLRHEKALASTKKKLERASSNTICRQDLCQDPVETDSDPAGSYVLVSVCGNKINGKVYPDSQSAYSAMIQEYLNAVGSNKRCLTENETELLNRMGYGPDSPFAHGRDDSGLGFWCWSKAGVRFGWKLLPAGIPKDRQNTEKPAFNFGTAPEGYDDLYVYVPDVEEIVAISEGTGDNLDDSDLEEGFVDYIYYETYMCDTDFPHADGGMLMLKELLRDKYKCLAECIPDVLELAYDNRDMEYFILTKSKE